MEILRYCKALADETRIRLINILQTNEFSVNEIVALMEMGQSRISRHLRILTDAGLLTCRRDGVWALYRTTPNGSGKALLDSLRFLLDNESLLLQDLQRAFRMVEERKNRSRHFFNTIAPDWDFLKKQILGDFDLNSALSVHIPPHGSIVDLGCGTGDFLTTISNGSRKLIGVDSSAKMLEQVRLRFQAESGKPELRLGELEHLPLKDKEADCVVVSMVLHHLLHPGAALQEIHRVLTPGGRLVIADLDKHQDEKMRTRYGDRWLGFSREEIESLLYENGFERIQMVKHKLKGPLALHVFRAEKRKPGQGHQKTIDPKIQPKECKNECNR